MFICLCVGYLSACVLACLHVPLASIDPGHSAGSGRSSIEKGGRDNRNLEPVHLFKMRNH